MPKQQNIQNEQTNKQKFVYNANRKSIPQVVYFR